jgi:hypothetical protein
MEIPSTVSGLREVKPTGMVCLIAGLVAGLASASALSQYPQPCDPPNICDSSCHNVYAKWEHWYYWCCGDLELNIDATGQQWDSTSCTRVVEAMDFYECIRPMCGIYYPYWYYLTTPCPCRPPWTGIPGSHGGERP